MNKLNMLYEEYKRNKLLNQNYTFDEAIEIYDKWKKSLSQSFNNFIQWELDKQKIQKKLEQWNNDHYIDDMVDYNLHYSN